VSEDKPSTPKRKGRPPKKKVVANKARSGVRPVGRPKGEAAIMAEYKARMLASPKSRKVLDAILDAALDNDHKHQAAAWKIVADRLLPVSQFEALTGTSSKPTITINISGVSDGVTISDSSNDTVNDITDAEYETVEE
jgi:hypothetical protein